MYEYNKDGNCISIEITPSAKVSYTINGGKSYNAERLDDDLRALIFGEDRPDIVDSDGKRICGLALHNYDAVKADYVAAMIAAIN